MLVFWPQRLVVLATPKTGTTSIEAALEAMADIAVLRPPTLKHTSAAAYRQHLAPYLEAAAGGRFRTVALMREPRDWLGSWYRARLRDAAEAAAEGLPPPWQARPAEAGADRPAALESFAAYVAAHLAEPPPAVAAVGAQADFLGAGEQGAAVDRLFRYDRFEAFTEFLEEALDCALELPRLNASPATDLSLPEEVEQQLRRARARDFALYDSLA